MKRYLFALLLLIPGAVYAADLTVGDLLDVLAPYPRDAKIEMKLEEGGLKLFVGGVPVPPPPPEGEEQQHIKDIRDFLTLGLPINSHWHVDGSTPTWQLKMIAEHKHRLTPTFRLPMMGVPMPVEKQIEVFLTRHQAMLDFVRVNRLGFVLRCNNIGDSFAFDRWRFPLEESSIPVSPLAWKVVDGVLNDVRVPDMFGPVSNFEIEGQNWGSGAFMQSVRMNLAAQPPPWWILRENNEGMSDGDNPKSYSLTLKEKRPDGFPVRQWLSREVMTTKSLRMRDHIYNDDGTLKEGIDQDPYKFWPEAAQRHVERMRTHFNAFQAVQTREANWPQGLYCGYGGSVDPNQPPDIVAEHGPSPRSMHLDTGSPRLYFTANNSDFTDPSLWSLVRSTLAMNEYRESKTGHTYRDRSVALSGKGILLGYEAHKHGPITPAKWNAFIANMFWVHQRSGIAVCMTYWDNASTPPEMVLLPEAQFPIADASEHPELKTTTIEEYLRAQCAAADQICEHPKLREFWIESTPVDMPQPTEPVQVWWTGRQRPGETLIHAWSPLEEFPATTIEIGGVQVEIPWPGYWVVSDSGAVERID